MKVISTTHLFGAKVTGNVQQYASFTGNASRSFHVYEEWLNPPKNQ